MTLRLPLEGVLVIGLENAATAPLSSRTLSDLGARTIKVERPGEGDMSRNVDQTCGPWSSVDFWVNFGKESITLDVKRTEAREILLRLVERADILIENLRPGLAQEVGLGYEMLSERNRRLVHCQVSGFGQTGPFSERKIFDLVMQGEAGFIELTGTEDAPARVGLGLCDTAAGLYATIAILAALHEARETGYGQHIDVSMLESNMWFLAQLPYRYWHKQEVPRRLGLRHPLICPSGVYETSDGRFAITVITKAQWVTLCKVISRRDLVDDPRFRTSEDRGANKAQLDAILEPIFRERPADEWVALFDSNGLPGGEVRTLPSALEHPQLLDRGFISELPSDHGPLKTFSFPARFRGRYHASRGAPPLLGQNTDDIMRELGYGDGEIAALRQQSII